MTRMYVVINGKLVEVTNNSGNGKSAYEIAIENGFEGSEQEWLNSLVGQGTVITINTETNNWELDGVDSGVKAIGENGVDGTTPTIEIDAETKHWIVNGEDTNIIAEGSNGVTPTIEISQDTKHWVINGEDSGILAQAENGKDGADAPVPSIQDGYWYIGEENTNVKAVAIDGKDGKNGMDAPMPSINENGHWFIGEQDTGIKATATDGKDGVDGIDGITPHIDSETKHWMVGETDTGIVAEGQNGQNGQDGQSGTSSYIKVSKKDGVTTITCTDADGETTAEILDGEKGEKGETGDSPTQDKQLRADIDYVSLRLGIDLENIEDISVKAKDYYDSNFWSKERLKILVINSVITSQIYEDITGEVYSR